MQIKVVYDPSVKAANFSGGAAQEVQFKTAINAVIALYDSLFTNNVTFTIDIGWGEYGEKTSANPGGSATGKSIPANAIAANQASYLSSQDSYQTVLTALTGNIGGQQSTTRSAAYASLPSSNPLPDNYLLTTENAEALGLTGTTSSATDLLGFGTGNNYYFGTGTPGTGQIDFMAVAEHEISEGMGRVALVGAGGNDGILDLFRYSASGVRDLTYVASGSTDTAYFSIDGGVTNLGTFNNDQTQTIYTPPGPYDLGDWAPSGGPGPGGNDCFGIGNTGVKLPLTFSDMTVMNVLGWNLSFNSQTVPNAITDYVTSGQHANAVTVQSGGYQEIGNNGLATGTVVAKGGSFQVDSGGIAGIDVIHGVEIDLGTDLNGTVSAGGYLMIDGGGVAGGETVAGGIEDVYGTDRLAVISNGGIQAIGIYGSAVSAAVLSGGLQSVASAGDAQSTTVSNGGRQIVLSSGMATGTAVSSGGAEWVGYHSGAGRTAANDSGGSATNDVVSSGGTEYVYLGGSVTSTSVLKGAKEIVSNGGSSTSAGISGIQYVDFGGVATGTFVFKGGKDVVSSGGNLVDAAITSGGAEVVIGTATDTTVVKKASEVVSAGGNSISAAIAGTQTISAGGASTGAVIVSGAIQSVYGTATATLVKAFADEIVYGGVASNTTLSGGVAWVSGGAANGTTIEATSEQTVYRGGSASGTIVDSGSAEALGNGAGLPGGVDTGTIVNNGGYEYVYEGGTASDTQVDSGGGMFVASGGTSDEATINHGQQTLRGIASGATIGSGGDQFVESGGVAFGTVISGGTLDVYAGGLIGGTTHIDELPVGPSFAAGAGGTLRVENSNDFTTSNGSIPINGFGGSDQIDLANVAYGWSTVLSYSVTNGDYVQLSVTDGTHVADLTLLGQYAAVGAFGMQSDGFGGTLVTCPAGPSGGARSIQSTSAATAPQLHVAGVGSANLSGRFLVGSDGSEGMDISYASANDTITPFLARFVAAIAAFRTSAAIGELSFSPHFGEIGSQIATSHHLQP